MDPTENEDEEEEPSEEITIAECFISAGLYRAIEFKDNNGLYFSLNEITSELVLDFYCPHCKRDSTFRAEEVEHQFGVVNYLREKNGEIQRTLTCTRDADHRAYFLFLVAGNTISKIGQWPSLADFAKESLKEYRGVLSEGDFKELSMATGLFAHGVGSGSFVYLRRIFERLIETAHTEAMQDAGWDDTLYPRLRFEEKIEALHGHLPPFVVEHRKLYGILSLGIHEVSEEDCLAAFPTVRAGIEAILDEHLHARRKAKKLAEAKKALQKVQQTEAFKKKA